ncbi:MULTISPECIES: fatty acid oxidation complex subunit alpha FadB [unclassified Delftia]|uniref:fatty acid oxidation complex subunit alpha FadB n=1 Tax=unclassified Delftia TaxID=2613839 RepID=UPI0019000D62|nr:MULTISPECIES: fatty acid oxidation complex subunit alpha FadB [unclassified Delftia]MBK0114038.1 fatty acid oxidation complex subunit alpha FadB [Delftia sp. S65]MBK0117846.1 fatty acid oxidation complex subunit alpha FadB [Delftia sp. S67]MBK0129155.1 fatty acid oxidation complex subunit alpha FadB [Delftia sp. S66]
MFQGQCVQLAALQDEGVYEVCFDRQGESINKFDARTIDELGQVVALLKSLPDLRGVLATSAKEVFIVGADITEFGEKFRKPAAEITADVLRSNEVFIGFEDLPVPSVVAINGFALGGGLEFVLANALRVMSETAQVGVPEVKLGLFPGFGGTVRLVRVAGPGAACEWVASGKPAGAAAALHAGVVDEVTPAATLREHALQCLRRAIAGEIDWQGRQQRKREPLASPAAQLEQEFADARARAQKAAAAHQPAALAAVDMMRRGASLEREAALRLEAEVFGEIAKTQAARAMVQTFLNEQAIKKIARQAGKSGRPVQRAAVIGAGIMGGGIAFTSALKGVPVQLHDIRAEALELGMAEAQKQLDRQLKSGRISAEKSAQVRAAIAPQLGSGGYVGVDFAIEAVVENLEVKRRLLAELEGHLAQGAIIASNTSSLRIDDMASALRAPDRLVGMHFFNPVPVMPLVEVVRGSQSSDAAVATAVAYATAMGKTAIVVRDCPGFLVNRVLTAYMNAFLGLIAEGADFVAIDQAMEGFGWPMGPAYLEDVVGIDTGSHVNQVISAGYPERMPQLEDDALRLMARQGRFGQKSGLGFYQYQSSSSGKPVRSPAADSHDLLQQALQPQGRREFTPQEIVDRMMLPMVLEAANALLDGVVGTAAEVDLAMQLGLGFPAYAGGPLQYADWLGLDELLRRCDRLQSHGPAYTPRQQLRDRAASGARFY